MRAEAAEQSKKKKSSKSKKKKSSKKKIPKTENVPLKKEIVINADIAKISTSSKEFNELIEKITKKNMLRPYPDINDIPN